MSRFFIDRPIFASVLSIIITLAGGIAVWALPIAQYPEITPPTVEVSAYYPGANAKTVADTVAAPIEQQVNGVENMMYMSSQCTNDGMYTLTVTFKHGVDLNMARVLVQNRESLAEPILPDLVKRRGVTVKKKSPSILMIVNLYSPSGQQRRPLPEQLRNNPASRRTGPSPRRRRHHLPRSARLQHADLARPRSDVVPQPDRHRCFHRHRPAKYPGRRRVRSASPRFPTRSIFPVHLDHARPTRRRRSVQEHHPQDRRRWPDCPPPRRGAKSNSVPNRMTRRVRWMASPRWLYRSTRGPARTL